MGSGGLAALGLVAEQVWTQIGARHLAVSGRLNLDGQFRAGLTVAPASSDLPQVVGVLSELRGELAPTFGVGKVISEVHGRGI
jgi:hypothetical protein